MVRPIKGTVEVDLRLSVAPTMSLANFAPPILLNDHRSPPLSLFVARLTRNSFSRSRLAQSPAQSLPSRHHGTGGYSYTKEPSLGYSYILVLVSSDLKGAIRARTPK